MNLAATGPVVPPLASGPWHGTQYVANRSRPIAMDASDVFIGFGSLAARSPCSLGMISSPPRGTRPVGMGNERSPGMIRGVWVMLSLQRTTIAKPQSPAAAPTTRRVRMKTYFTRRGPSSRLHFFGAGGSQELVHGGGALRGAVDRHTEAVVGEPGVEARARLYAGEHAAHGPDPHRRQSPHTHPHTSRSCGHN